MSTVTRVAAAAIVVAAIGLTWLNFRPAAGPGTVTPTATAEMITFISQGPLEPGRYAFDYLYAAGADSRDGPTVAITVPSEGWTGYQSFAVDKNYGPNPSEAGASFVVWRIENRYVNPCVQSGTPPPALFPSPGPGIDELLGDLANQAGLAAGPLTPVTIDGFSGKFVELTVVADIATCVGGFFPWIDKFVQGNNELLRVYALDVDGFRLTFFLRIPERTPPADRAELESIVASITIEP